MIQNGLQTTIDWSQSEEFNTANAAKHMLFGKMAVASGESPFKAVCTFKDGNIVGLRGDKYVFPNYVEMLANLHKMALSYVAANKLYQVKIYDNRMLLPNSEKEILYWNEDKGTIINLLPLYSGRFDIKKRSKSKYAK